MDIHDDEADAWFWWLFRLFGPPLPRSEQKIQDLVLYNPWTRVTYVYRLSQDGFIRGRSLGQVDRREARNLEMAYRKDFDDAE